MRLSRLLFALSTLAVALPIAPATSSGLKSEVLTEVQSHLDEAQKCFDRGTYDLAVAHANMVLVSEELRYTVEFQSVPEQMRPNAEKALSQALSAWESALKGTLHFRRVESSEDQDVQIRFKPDVRMGKEPVAGYANWKRVIDKNPEGKAEGKFTADLQIRTMNLSFRPMMMEAMRHEIMHEMGHVLGLEDAEDTGLIMGPLDMNHPVDKPRAQEVKAVLDLRTQAIRIRRDAQAQVIKD